MSLYTTGELAKKCNVSVRTIQYYDERGILVPTDLTEGGRRLFSEKDVATPTLDSTLAFTAQTASVTHAENVQITGQNFGFDPENGVTEVKLDPNQPHYYLEIQPVPKETD